MLFFIGKYFVYFERKQGFLKKVFYFLHLAAVEREHEIGNGGKQQVIFSVWQRFFKLLKIALIIKHGMKTRKPVFRENKKGIAKHEIVMVATGTLPDIAVFRLAQNT